MKKLIPILIFLCAMQSVVAQNPSTWYNIYSFYGYGSDNRGNLFWVAMPKDSAVNPGTRRPVFIQWYGLGEMGSGNLDWANASQYGPLREIFVNGEQMSFTEDGQTVWPIYIGCQLNAASHDPVRYFPARDYILNRYASIIDTNRIYRLGVSLGGKSGPKEVVYDTNSVATLNKYKVIASFSPAATEAPFTANIPKLAKFARLGGQLLVMTGTRDAQPPYFPADLLPTMNAARSGSGVGVRWANGDGNGISNDTHCCWAEVEDEDKNYGFLNGLNVYEYCMQFSKKPYTSVPAATVNLPSGTTSTTVAGVISKYPNGHNGWENTIAWTKISGSGTIAAANNPTLTVNGLSAGTSVYRLTSANANGQTSTSDVTLIVASGDAQRYGFKAIN